MELSRWSKMALIALMSSRQIHAVQAALDKVSGIILEGHLHSCLITAVRGENPDERERVLTEIADVFGMKKFTLINKEKSNDNQSYLFNT